jgi:CubicO group peptidase (beta-lactamase class C family)
MTKLVCKLGVVMGAVLLVSACQDGESTLSSQPANVADRVPSGISAEDLEPILDLMETAITDRRITAAIAMLARDGEMSWLGTAGEMEPGIPMRDDAILPLASVGKMFTATAAMILYERGALSLDDPVSKYIPEFAEVMVGVTNEDGTSHLAPPNTPITVYHLLTHTGGLTVTGNDFWAAWDAHTETTTTTHFARALAELPLQSQPGTQFEYGQTGASYEVLAAVIEIASGQTLEEFMTGNIFEPLGLGDSYFYVPEEKSARLPAIYRRVDDVLQLDRLRGDVPARSTFFHGGGGVSSSAEDILRFSRLFLEGGSVDGVRILEAETIERMMTDQIGDKAPERWKPRGLSWGFGAAVEYSQDEVGSGSPGQYGWVGGGFAKLWVNPKEQLIAYFNFPLTPPGDNELLVEFEERVDAAMAASHNSP